MRALDSMVQKLRPMGLYRLTGNTIVEAELAAAAQGLDCVYEELDRLLQEAFLPTARELGLAMRELAFGSERKDLSLNHRRDMLMHRNAVTVNDNTKEGMERTLLAVGIRASIFENPREQKLYISCVELLDQTMERARLVDSVIRFLPAHLELSFDFGKITWDYLHQTEKNFGELARADLTWEQIQTLE